MNRAREPLLVCRDIVAGHRMPVVGPLGFTLAAGEVVGLLGPNGCGKSTLLGALTGTSRLFSGAIERRPGLRLTHHRQRVERPHELPMTGRDLLRTLAADHRPPPAPLTSMLDRRLDHLSGGQFQLVLIWATLASGSDLVLLDEPTNHLDPAAVDVLCRLLTEGADERAVLVVSHEAAFLSRVCSRVVELVAGYDADA